jgi:uncharacterized protein YoxC
VSDLLLIAALILAIAVVAFSVRTLVQTRKKYYEDYLKRKRNG